jgi:HEAT repeat protein
MRVLNRLVEQLHDSDSLIRENSAYLLGELAFEARAVSENTLKSSEQLERLNALTNPKNATAAVNELIKVLADTNPWVRGNTADALGKFGHAIAIAPLSVLLDDEDKVVRYSVTEALGSIGTEECVEYLIKALLDDEWSVRLIAAKSLEKIPDKRAEAALKKTAKDSNADVRQRSLAALAKLTV